MKGWQFKNVLEIIDPITKEKNREPMKPFMVNQLQIAFERSKMILSPFDEDMHKQLIDYEVIKIGSNGNPVFTSVNEHSIDALGLAYLAFVLEFPDLTDSIKKPENSSKILHSRVQVGQSRLNMAMREIEAPMKERETIKTDDLDLRGDRQTWIKAPMHSSKNFTSTSWGSRRSTGRGAVATRSMW